MFIVRLDARHVFRKIKNRLQVFSSSQIYKSFNPDACSAVKSVIAGDARRKMEIFLAIKIYASSELNESWTNPRMILLSSRYF